ncbi:MAG: hypothetical protein BWX50_01063 [Euryarchaeota archaeon ADurb.Bin009]|nr:MAG: hypothetical protein BWX50_01063 [Euryarchaeota archaeon ADurb.Bin009]
MIGSFEHNGDREDLADRVPSEEFREPLPEPLARGRPDSELVFGLAVGEDVGVRSRHELCEAVGDVLVDVLHRLQVNEIYRCPGEELRIPDVSLPLGDILEDEGAPSLPALKRRRDRLHLVEGLAAVIPPVGDIGDHLLPLEVLDEGERFQRRNDRKGRFPEVPAHEFLLRTPKPSQALVVCLDDREVGVEDQDQVFRETEKRREGYALRDRIDLCVADKPGLDLTCRLHHLKVL